MSDTLNTLDTSDTALVILARYPQPGTTKTRLARSLGDEATIRLYRAFLGDLALKFSGQERERGERGERNAYDLLWAYTPADANYAAFISSLVPRSLASMQYFPQQGEGLGERLLAAFRHTYELGYRRSVLIGSDSPHIKRDIVTRAWAALDDAEVVLGPAEDGGYYLIAMRQPYDVFRDIPMSTDKVLQMTIELAQRQGLRVRTLETLFDVDELPDLQRLALALKRDDSQAPMTATCLSTIKEFV